MIKGSSVINLLRRGGKSIQTIQTFIIGKFNITEPVIRDFRVVRKLVLSVLFSPRGQTWKKGKKFLAVLLHD